MAWRSNSVVLTLCAVVLACSDRSIDSQCFPVDPRGVWHVDDPWLVVEGYCDRGSTKIEGLRRLPRWHCVPMPEEGCDPCMLSKAEADAVLLDSFMARAEEVGCASDFGPAEVVRGCFAEVVEIAECCWTSEFFYDEAVCDVGPATTYP